MNSSLNILLMPVGSAGDVHPFLAVGLELRRRGHGVCLATNGHFRAVVEGAGLRFIELGSSAEYDRIADNPDLWHRTRGGPLVFREAASPVMRMSYDIIEAEWSAGPLVVIASSLAFGARVAQDRLGVPTATCHLQPTVFRSIYDGTDLGMRLLSPRVPRWLRRILLRVGDRVVVDRLIGPGLNALRAEVGLDPVTHIFSRWWHSPQLVIGLWPEWYAEPQQDWPPRTRTAGFVFYDAAEQKPMPPALERTLDECEARGDRPIVVTGGSAMRHGARFFLAAAEACRRLGRHGVLITQDAGQLPRPLPPGVEHHAYAPFGRLFPRAAAVMHHGGIGTCAQAMRAGVPQLIVPFSHDQPDNARRVSRLGAGAKLAQRNLRPARVAAALGRLLADETVAGRCRELAARFASNDAVATTCDLLERLGQGNPV
ncbi:MAG: O-mycaminosyltylonolide 6-deoxyallosyltransferase [Phycisphaerae bacterium]|nr:O-mycaminosyltylonolide 6-deoxyallosyltransferase [Phycisphaerae bacterium]